MRGSRRTGRESSGRDLSKPGRIKANLAEHEGASSEGYRLGLEIQLGLIDARLLPRTTSWSASNPRPAKGHALDCLTFPRGQCLAWKLILVAEVTMKTTPLERCLLKAYLQAVRQNNWIVAEHLLSAIEACAPPEAAMSDAVAKAYFALAAKATPCQQTSATVSVSADAGG